MIRLTNEKIRLKNEREWTVLQPGETTDGKGIEKTMARKILQAHNRSEDPRSLKIRFDKLTSHDITYVGIIQTARASGLERFPMPYILTNCHNSLCAVGGTINEDDHMFGLTCAKRYGGIYVPPHQAVIHQYAREMLAECGSMILGSDSHTRYGALGTMAMGEGGPELVKQLLNRTYDIPVPQVIAVWLEGEPVPGVGPQDVALAIIGAVFANGYVNNKVMEFIGPGVDKLSADFRIGIDVMTTETTCLSSIWKTDERIREYYAVHGREDAYKELKPEDGAVYDGCICVNLSEIRPMIAMPFHPSHVYRIEDFNHDPEDILHEVECRAGESLDGQVPYSLQDKLVTDGSGRKRFLTEQGIIAGCAGGGYENLCAAADILRGRDIGSGAFTMSVYPASMPVYMELVKNGSAADLMAAGVVVKTAFCGPCFGAGDTPANQSFSIRHSTRNFPNREGSKLQNGQIASVALMDARSIAATAANHGFLTPATQVDVSYTDKPYFFDAGIYEKRVFDSHGTADPTQEIRFGPNIKDWPGMTALPENLLLKVVSEIHDAVTTTDELIPSGETSSYRSNPLGLAEFTLSRKDPAYVGRAKEVRAAEECRRALAGNAAQCGQAAGSGTADMNGKLEDAAGALSEVLPELSDVLAALLKEDSSLLTEELGIGSTIYAVKPGDGSAREQAASCQKVLGGWANIASDYATKRYRSNLINWGMLPFLYDGGTTELANGDYIYVPKIKDAVIGGAHEIPAYVVKDLTLKPVLLRMGDLTETEREIICAGCLINYYRNEAEGERL